MKTMVSTGGSEPSGARGSSDVLLRGVKAGPWVVEHELGRGGMGAVYAVVHEQIGKRAALKVVHQRLLGPGFNSDRMMQEAKVVNQVGHPNIVDIFETGKLADGRPYIVMERLTGQALSVRADECKLVPEFVIALLLQVCDALLATHAAGIIHRDLKLDNVFLVDNPEDPAMPKVKLLDWGIAKVTSHGHHAKHTIEGQLVGTPQYLAPEQARGHEVSPKTDVYSLGVMAYELFLEQPPFEAETAAEVIAMHLRTPPPPPRTLWHDIPSALHDLLLAMLAKIPDQRPTIREVIRRLEAVRAELERRYQVPTSSRHPTATPIEAMIPACSPWPSPSDRRSPWQSRLKRWGYAVGVCVVLASAMRFLVSRVAGQAASAATEPDARVVSEAARGLALPAAARPDRATARQPQPFLLDLESGLEQRPRPATGSTTAPVPPGPAAGRPTRPLLVAAPAVHTPSPLPRSASPRATPARTSSVAPHRGIKLDPDGTLDPYR
ncbi:MAG TPA: protein kinase [Kofleriaceae bacterium]|nr:protein kinase [Kofleriaceae bacterium]